MSLNKYHHSESIALTTSDTTRVTIVSKKWTSTWNFPTLHNPHQESPHLLRRIIPITPREQILWIGDAEAVKGLETPEEEYRKEQASCNKNHLTQRLCAGWKPQTLLCKATHPVAKAVMAIYERLLTAPSTKHPQAFMEGTLVLHINIGELLYCKTAGQVAWSPSHEISHALARSLHEKNFYERTEAYTSSLNALEEQSWALEAAENAEELDELRFLALSRYHEYEADYIGMVIAAEAGFDPQHAIDSLKATQLGDAIYESDVEEEESHPSEGEKLLETDTDILVLNRISALRPFLEEVREKKPRSVVDKECIEALEAMWQSAYDEIWRGIQKDTDSRQPDSYVSPETKSIKRMARAIKRDI
ncbi:hypothetical protein BKA65DRAFT_552688 [Rhexocercosporidium sp. MPI-PUGE-AT-0058]|nr:hypothetical protein BKA65DRAFT_552688 [Rhexocercosporidium sp. MPI-PUGE-AT-0058]